MKISNVEKTSQIADEKKKKGVYKNFISGVKINIYFLKGNFRSFCKDCYQSDRAIRNLEAGR